MTSAVSMASTRSAARLGMAYSRRVARHSRSFRPPFQLSAWMAMTVSHAWAKVGTRRVRRRGSRPSATARALSSAFSRAAARVTTGYAPRPMLVVLPLGRMACAHDLESPPWAAGLTRRLKPWPP